MAHLLDVLLTASQVTWFTKDRVLGVIDRLVIKENEVIGLWGSNGVGKTTLIKILAGLKQKQSYEGEVSRQDGLRIGYLPQDPEDALQPWRTCIDNAYIAAGQQCTKDDLRKRLTDDFGLEKYLMSYPNELSGGFEQRLGWACAFSPHNKLVFLDEPFSKQDACWTNKLVCFIRKQSTQLQKAVVLVGHDPELLAICSNRIYMLFEHMKAVKAIDVTLSEDERKFDSKEVIEYGLRMRRLQKEQE